MNFLWDNFFRKGRREDKISDTIQNCFLFESLSHRESQILINSCHIRTYRPGEPIFQQGEAGVGMYIVVSGKVDIRVDDTTSNEKTPSSFVTQLAPGDFFGELALVEEKHRRSASAISCGESTMIGLFKPDLMDIAERSPSTGVKITTKLSAVLGRRLRETSFKISELKRQVDQLKPTSKL